MYVCGRFFNGVCHYVEFLRKPNVHCYSYTDKLEKAHIMTEYQKKVFENYMKDCGVETYSYKLESTDE